MILTNAAMSHDRANTVLPQLPETQPFGHSAKHPWLPHFEQLTQRRFRLSHAAQSQPARLIGHPRQS